MKKGWSSYMDRRLKERLVGATILVVLIVLIVPELLSGPKRSANSSPAAAAPAQAVRNVTVDLATNKATADEEAAAASAASSPAEAPSAATAPPAPEGSTAPEHAASSDDPARADGVPHARTAAPPTVTTLKAQQPTAPPLENEVPSPKSATIVSKSGAPRETMPAAGSRHGWSVQIGSFASHANAEKLVHQLKAHDPSAYVSSSGKGASLRYRVRIGPLADRGAAERTQSKLKKAGLSASLVPP
jgi:DedD protein